MERPGRVNATIKADSLTTIAAFLRKELGFDHTKAVAGVDYLPPENKIVVLYWVGSYLVNELNPIILALRVELDRNNPTLPTLTGIWESANYFEREAWEMFGINFEGHPKLEKLMLQDNWHGPPPMRKDMKFPETG